MAVIAHQTMWCTANRTLRIFCSKLLVPSSAHMDTALHHVAANDMSCIIAAWGICRQPFRLLYRSILPTVT